MLNDMPMDEPATSDLAGGTLTPSEVLVAIQRGIAKAREQFTESLSGVLERVSDELGLWGRERLN